MSTDIGFTLRVPASWYEFDIWRATRTGDLARLVDARIAEHPDLAAHRSGLLKLLRAAAETAEAEGAVYGASMLEFSGDDLIVANLMVFHTERSSEHGHDTLDAIASEVPAVAPSEESAEWRQVEIVEIAAGRAVRVHGIESIGSPDGQMAPVVVMHTLIPVPDDKGVLDLVLTSPQLELTLGMLDLFDAVSGTLDWPDNHDPHNN